MYNEQDVQARIGEVEAELHRLRTRATAEGLDPAERATLGSLEVELDRLWDQVRRFRAGTPDADELRPTQEVEGYLQ
jgi:Protein of unknown function (DUF2630)